MRAGELSVGLLVATAVAASNGCAGSHQGPHCSDPVGVAEYTIAILPIADGGRYGWRFELSNDGTFSGHLSPPWPGAPARCDGALTPDEAERLTDAINAGEFFCRGNTFYDDAFDFSYNDIALETLDGSRDNRFCGHNVDVYDRALSELSGAASTALLRVHESGGCTGPAYEVPTSTAHCSLWPRPPPTPPP